MLATVLLLDLALGVAHGPRLAAFQQQMRGYLPARHRAIVDELDAPYDFPDNDDDDDDDSDDDDESAGDGRYRQGPATRALPSKSLGGSHVPPPASWEDHPVRKARRNSVKLRFD